MSEALLQLIRQAEVQKLQMETQIRFQENLAMFKERMPNVFRVMEKHQPERYRLHLDHSDKLNLLDTQDKRFLYDEDPSSVCKEQVDHFAKHAKVRRYLVAKNKVYNDSHIHIPRLNSLIDEYEKNKAERIKGGTPSFIPSLIVSGVGLGYHLPQLTEAFDIQNTIIYEQCLDTFFASMHVIDWGQILNYFKQNGRSISICLNVEPRKALSLIEHAVNKNGLHSYCFTYVFQHTKRPSDTDFLNIYHKELPAFIGGLGYFDDEQIGLAHAYHNLRSNSGVFINNKTFQRKTRLLLIGNGPSLDEHQAYIERNRDNVIVMSCGTALSSLLRMGIKPDFHVEMERCIMVNDVIRHFSKTEDRNDITLLCLHTVAPETIAAFPESCYAIKANDAGSQLVKNYFLDQKINDLVYCNPTVANCGLSFAISMGFEEIHLIGVDFGVLEAEKHHSKHSVYNEMEAFAKKQKIDYTIYDQNRAVPCKGNLGGTAMCMPTLNMARIMVERFLKFLKPAFPNLRVINTNHGAFIDGTESLPLLELPDAPYVDAKKEIESIKSNHIHYFKNKKFEKSSKEKLLSYFYSLKDQLHITTEIKDDKSLYLELRRIYKLIRNEFDPTTHFLLRGSINSFFGSIVEHSMYCPNKDEFARQVAIGTTHYNNFIDEVYSIMTKEPFKLDETYSGYVKAMKERETENLDKQEQVLNDTQPI